jgi:hypothetical protein
MKGKTKLLTNFKFFLYQQWKYCRKNFKVYAIFLSWKLLTPKVLETIFQAFLKFGQAIVDAMFVQKISNFWWTCGLVLPSRRTNFYKIPIFGLGVIPQKQNSFILRAGRAAKKTFYFFTFSGWIFFHRFLTKFLNISSIWKSSKTHRIY